jgi:hypothetical protein
MKMKKNKKAVSTIWFILMFVVLLIVFVGYAIWDNYNKATKNNILNPNNVIVKTPTPANTKPIVNVKITSTTYPNTNLTPGHLQTMDDDFLCYSGMPEKLTKNTSDAVKKQVFKSYHLTYPPTKEYTIDRYIPTSLGGSDNIKNLWPQSVTPPGYKEKNIAENYLYKLMCNKTINISTAQQRIKTDWVVVYKEAILK